MDGGRRRSADGGGRRTAADGERWTADGSGRRTADSGGRRTAADARRRTADGGLWGVVGGNKSLTEQRWWPGGQGREEEKPAESCDDYSANPY